MGTIERFGQGYQLTRYTPGAYTLGKWEDGPIESEWTMQACIQPMSPYEQAQQPDGWRTRELVKVYTRFPLRAAREDLQVRGDRFQYQGKTFEVMSITDWSLQPGAAGDLMHFKAVAALVEDSPRGA